MARIYVASLSDYNSGRLHGVWIGLDGKDADDVQGEIAAMLRTSKHPNVTVECPECAGVGNVQLPANHRRDFATCAPCPVCKGNKQVPSAEEWSIHDYDECPNMGENPSLEALLEQVRLLDEHGDAWAAYTALVGVEDATESDFEDCRAGSAESELDWINQHLDDTGVLTDVPENLRSYFDSYAFLRDMKYGGDVNFETVNGTLYAFWNR